MENEEEGKRRGKEDDDGEGGSKQEEWNERRKQAWKGKDKNHIEKTDGAWMSPVKGGWNAGKFLLEKRTLCGQELTHSHHKNKE